MRCTGKEQLTCNEEKMGCEGCYYAKEEASIQEDIKVLEKLANRTYKIDKDGWETAVCSIDEQLAIRNIIARNKELEENQCCMTVCMRKDKEKLFLENKVRAKIEEYEELVKEFEEYWSKDPRQFKKEKCVDYYKIEALEELLQEGDK